MAEKRRTRKQIEFAILLGMDPATAETSAADAFDSFIELGKSVYPVTKDAIRDYGRHFGLRFAREDYFTIAGRLNRWLIDRPQLAGRLLAEYEAQGDAATDERIDQLDLASQRKLRDEGGRFRTADSFYSIVSKFDWNHVHPDLQKALIEIIAYDPAFIQRAERVPAEREAHTPAASIPYQRSFSGAAVIVLLLYSVFWLPGAVANAIFYEDAKAYKRTTGHTPPGMDALQTMFMLLAVFPVILVIALIVLVLTIALVGTLSSGSRSSRPSSSRNVAQVPADVDAYRGTSLKPTSAVSLNPLFATPTPTPVPTPEPTPRLWPSEFDTGTALEHLVILAGHGYRFVDLRRRHQQDEPALSLKDDLDFALRKIGKPDSTERNKDTMILRYRYPHKGTNWIVTVTFDIGTNPNNRMFQQALIRSAD